MEKKRPILIAIASVLVCALVLMALGVCYMLLRARRLRAGDAAVPGGGGAEHAARDKQEAHVTVFENRIQDRDADLV